MLGWSQETIYYEQQCDTNRCQNATRQYGSKLIISKAPEMFAISFNKIDCFFNVYSNKIKIQNLNRVSLRIGEGNDKAYYYINGLINQNGNVNEGHYTSMHRDSMTDPWYFMNDAELKLADNVQDFSSKCYLMILTKRGN